MYDKKQLNEILVDLDNKVYEYKVMRYFSYIIFRFIYENNFRPNENKYEVKMGERIKIESHNYIPNNSDDYEQDDRFHSYTMYYDDEKIFKITIFENNDIVKIDNMKLFLHPIQYNEELVGEILRYVGMDNEFIKFTDITCNFLIE